MKSLLLLFFLSMTISIACFTVSFKGKQMIMDHAIATTVYEKQ